MEGNNLSYPKDVRENLLYRANIISKCETDIQLRSVVLKACEVNILYFFNVLLWTYDPRPAMNHLPFITYPFQDEYILNLQKTYRDKEDCLTEKSRDMGVSWMMLGFLLYEWRFGAGFSALLGSYIEDLVDNWALDSHFGRLEYLIDRLPKWFLPEGFELKKHRTKMKIENPATGNMLMGYAPTERFSRAGRYSIIFADELAFWEHARSAWKAMGDATKCRFTASTVNGKGNQFADLALKSNIKKFTLHWKLHPKKDEAWYENEKKRRSEEEVAQELDINYNKSAQSRVYPEFTEWNYNGKEEYDPMQPLFVSWDFGLRDETAILWIQVDSKSGYARVIDSYQNSGKTIDFFVPFVTGQIKSLAKYKYTPEEFEMIDLHKKWQEAVHFGDPTGENQHQTSKNSVIGQLREHGIYVNTNRKDFQIKDRIAATKMLIRRLKVDKDLVEFIDAIENSRYPQRKDTSQATTAVEKPIHDWTSHFRTALEFYAVNEKLKGGIGRMVEVAKKAAVRVTAEMEKMLDNKFNKKYNNSKTANNANNPKYKRCVW